MSDYSVIRSGQVNATGDARALFLKVFSGEVMTAFSRRNVFMPLHLVKTIDHGKTAQFPAHGVATAHYHVPGTELVGSGIKGAERTINVDQLLVSDVSIANIDEAMAHYDTRSIYTAEMGKVLARRLDTNLAQLMVLAARGSATVSGGPSGTVINSITNVNSASELIDALFVAGEDFDNNSVDEERYCALRPHQYGLLVKNTVALNRDWGGAGSFSQGTLPEINGIKLVKTIAVPSTNIAAAITGEENVYYGDFSKTVAVVFTRHAIGTVKLLDISTEMEYSVARQGTLVVSKYAMGHGILRPECAIEIAQA